VKILMSEVRLPAKRSRSVSSGGLAGGRRLNQRFGSVHHFPSSASKDFGSYRRMFADDVVGFGTHMRLVNGLDELETEQWRSIWGRISDFRFVTETMSTGLSQDGLNGWGLSLWLRRVTTRAGRRSRDLDAPPSYCLAPRVTLRGWGFTRTSLWFPAPRSALTESLGATSRRVWAPSHGPHTQKVGGRARPPTCWVADGARTRDIQDHNLAVK
jgi:hypothetical protein